MYLKGLHGLKVYGNDESYISMKVWLEGGTCKLLKDVVVSHIYRDNPPYTIENASRIYNRLLISELLLPDSHRARIGSFLKRYHHYEEALKIFYRSRKENYLLKEYYTNCFQRKFAYFENLNERYCQLQNPKQDSKTLLQDIANHIVLNNGLYTNLGLINGRFGMILFLFHCGRYLHQNIYIAFAELILERILTEISENLSVDFSDGLTGIGWGIEYLSQNEFIEGDTTDLLEEIDRKVLSLDVDSVDNIKLGGIFQYVLSRLYSITKKNGESVFDHDFLFELYQKAKYVMESDADCDCLDVYLRFVMFFENSTTSPKPSIYDIVPLNIPENYNFRDFACGLDGSAGVGLKLILG